MFNFHQLSSRTPYFSSLMMMLMMMMLMMMVIDDPNGTTMVLMLPSSPTPTCGTQTDIQPAVGSIRIITHQSVKRRWRKCGDESSFINQ